MALLHTHAANGTALGCSNWARPGLLSDLISRRPGGRSARLPPGHPFLVIAEVARCGRPHQLGNSTARVRTLAPSPPHCVCDADKHGDHLDRARQVRQADLSLSPRLSTFLGLLFWAYFSGPYFSGASYRWDRMDQC